MTRMLPLILAAALSAAPALAGGIGFGLPNLTYPDGTTPVTKGCADPAAMTLVVCEPAR